ncbi:hypothetical protein [Pseudomonas sp. ML96]|uniref:hypothetical protein n=1 Tax=Pseudomonas sp. ML96 TaxID=1523503 RepID=UPI0012E008DC|nr:hypothetical protein [Pseudomonas sp. ML96]
MIIVFDDSDDSTEVLAEILTAGIAGISGLRAAVLERIALVSELAQSLDCKISTHFTIGLSVAELAYLYDSQFYSLDDIKLMILESGPAPS